MDSEQLVVRPSGVWNSRSPLNDYIQQDRAISKSCSVSTLALYVLRERLSSEPAERSGRQVLKNVTKARAGAGQAWLNYRRSHGNDAEKKAIQPTVGHLLSDSALCLDDLQETAIVRLSSTFEAFAQCWALNYLLARLESGASLSTPEAKLASGFLPIARNKVPPGWPQIVNAIPELRETLARLPGSFTNPKTGARIVAPVSPTLTALAAIQFWRAYRNLTVHSSRLITRRFHKRFASYFTEAMECYGHVRELSPGRPLQFHGDLYGAMAAAHYRSALSMNEMLEETSHCRRGHPESPNPKTTVHWMEPPRSPALLVKGDHDLSFAWTTDAVLRSRMAQQYAWELDEWAG